VKANKGDDWMREQAEHICMLAGKGLLNVRDVINALSAVAADREGALASAQADKDRMTTYVQTLEAANLQCTVDRDDAQSKAREYKARCDEIKDIVGCHPSTNAVAGVQDFKDRLEREIRRAHERLDEAGAIPNHDPKIGKLSLMQRIDMLAEDCAVFERQFLRTKSELTTVKAEIERLRETIKKARAKYVDIFIANGCAPLQGNAELLSIFDSALAPTAASATPLTDEQKARGKEIADRLVKRTWPPLCTWCGQTEQNHVDSIGAARDHEFIAPDAPAIPSSDVTSSSHSGRVGDECPRCGQIDGEHHEECGK